MIELRWIWHDMKNGAPPQGSISVSDRLYQKLQYRCVTQVFDYSSGGTNSSMKMVFSAWEDVPHSGVIGD